MSRTHKIRPGQKGYVYEMERLHPVSVLGDEAMKSIMIRTFSEDFEKSHKPMQIHSWQNRPQARLEDMINVMEAVVEHWTPGYVKEIKDIKLLDLLKFMHDELESNQMISWDLHQANIMVRLHNMPQLVLTDPLGSFD
jgi:hypothetical protein